MVNTAVSIGHVLLALALVGLILLQRGKGAEAGAAFGAGASGTVFGSAGSGSFLTRLTGILATLFFATSLTLAYLAGQAAPKSVLERAITPGTDMVEEVELSPIPDDAELPALPELSLPDPTLDTEEPETPQ